MTARGNHIAGGVTLALALFGAVAAERYSANANGIVKDARTDVRYAGDSRLFMTIDVETKAAGKSRPLTATDQRVEASPAEAQPATMELRSGTVTVAGKTVGSGVPPAVPNTGGQTSSIGAPTLCASTPLNEPAPGVCGWYKAEAGDKYHPKTYGDAPWGWGPNYIDVTPGTWHFVYGVLITHVTALRCDDARVIAAVANGRRNVFCETDDGGLRQRNADDATLTPLLVFSDGDRTMDGRFAEAGR